MGLLLLDLLAPLQLLAFLVELEVTEQIELLSLPFSCGLLAAGLKQVDGLAPFL